MTPVMVPFYRIIFESLNGLKLQACLQWRCLILKLLCFHFTFYLQVRKV